jgi:putative tricarboxylic transport membrane protein
VGSHGNHALCTPVALFFFFEVTLRILLPKGVTEPWFYPLYATFF